MHRIGAVVSSLQLPRWLRNPGYLFVAPSVILIFLLAFYPTFRVIDMSLTETNRRTGETAFVGLANYAKILADPVFPKAFKQTLIFSASSSVGHITLGLLLALAMNSSLNRRILGACRAAILLPWALSPIVVAIIAQLWAYPPISPVTKALAALGSTAEFSPLASPRTALWSLTAVNVWQFTPFYMLMILAGLQSLDPELLDAARVDGAGRLECIVYVTIPHIREQLLTLSLFDLVTTAAYFDLIWVTTQGGPVRSTEVLATYIYRRAFANMNWNMASAAGVVLLVLCIGITALVVARMQRE
ncbi:MAG: carbohydrate ABC transporter permease [Anaerolineae bacterium]